MLAQSPLRWQRRGSCLGAASSVSGSGTFRTSWGAMAYCLARGTGRGRQGEPKRAPRQKPLNPTWWGLCGRKPGLTRQGHEVRNQARMVGPRWAVFGDNGEAPASSQGWWSRLLAESQRRVFWNSRAQSRISASSILDALLCTTPQPPTASAPMDPGPCGHSAGRLGLLYSQ